MCPVPSTLDDSYEEVRRPDEHEAAAADSSIDISFEAIDSSVEYVVVWDFWGGLTRAPAPSPQPEYGYPNPVYSGYGDQKPGTYLCEISKLRGDEQGRRIIRRVKFYRIVLQVLEQSGVINLLAAPELVQPSSSALQKSKFENLFAYLEDAFPNQKIPMLDKAKAQNMAAPIGILGNGITYQQSFYKYYKSQHPNKKIVWVGEENPCPHDAEDGFQFVTATEMLDHIYVVLNHTIGMPNALSKMNLALSIMDPELDPETISLFLVNETAKKNRHIWDGDYSRCYLRSQLRAIAYEPLNTLTHDKNKDQILSLNHLRKKEIGATKLITLSEFETKHFLRRLLRICKGCNLETKLLEQFNQPKYTMFRELISQNAVMTENDLNVFQIELPGNLSAQLNSILSDLIIVASRLALIPLARTLSEILQRIENEVQERPTVQINSDQYLREILGHIFVLESTTNKTPYEELLYLLLRRLKTLDCTELKVTVTQGKVTPVEIIDLKRFGYLHFAARHKPEKLKMTFLNLIENLTEYISKFNGERVTYKNLNGERVTYINLDELYTDLKHSKAPFTETIAKWCLEEILIHLDFLRPIILNPTSIGSDTILCQRLHEFLLKQLNSRDYFILKLIISNQPRLLHFGDLTAFAEAIELNTCPKSLMLNFIKLFLFETITLKVNNILKHLECRTGDTLSYQETRFYLQWLVEVIEQDFQERSDRRHKQKLLDTLNSDFYNKLAGYVSPNFPLLANDLNSFVMLPIATPKLPYANDNVYKPRLQNGCSKGIIEFLHVQLAMISCKVEEESKLLVQELRMIPHNKLTVEQTKFYLQQLIQLLLLDKHIAHTIVHPSMQRVLAIFNNPANETLRKFISDADAVTINDLYSFIAQEIANADLPPGANRMFAGEIRTMQKRRSITHGIYSKTMVRMLLRELISKLPEQHKHLTNIDEALLDPTPKPLQTYPVTHLSYADTRYYLRWMLMPFFVTFQENRLYRDADIGKYPHAKQAESMTTSPTEQILMLLNTPEHEGLSLCIDEALPLTFKKLYNFAIAAVSIEHILANS